jgi:hypothetical protein
MGIGDEDRDTGLVQQRVEARELRERSLGLGGALSNPALELVVEP